MPAETTPNRPLNADPETEQPGTDPGPKGSGTLEKEVQPANAEPENPDQNTGSGTGPKGDGTLNKMVEPTGRG